MIVVEIIVGLLIWAAIDAQTRANKAETESFVRHLRDLFG
jgi:hypothetical protein